MVDTVYPARNHNDWAWLELVSSVVGIGLFIYKKCDCV